MECSAKSGDNVIEAFESLGKLYMEKNLEKKGEQTRTACKKAHCVVG